MIRGFLFLIAITISLSLGAQEDMIFPRTRLGVTPSALLNVFPAVQFSFDKRITKKVNFSLESAYIFNNFENAKGFRVRPGVEVFIARSPWVSFVSGIHYNYRYSISYNERRNFATNGEFEFIQYNARTDLSLGGINFENKLMFKVNERVYLDLGGGLGVGIIRRTTNEPDPQFNAQLELGGFNGSFTIPGVIFYSHINFSYALVR